MSCLKRCFDLDFDDTSHIKKQRTCSFDSDCSTIFDDEDDDTWMVEKGEQFLESIKDEMDKSERFIEIIQDSGDIFIDDIENEIGEIITTAASKSRSFRCYDAELLTELNTIIYNSFWLNNDAEDIFLSDDDVEHLSANIIKLTKDKVDDYLNSRNNFF